MAKRLHQKRGNASTHCAELLRRHFGSIPAIQALNTRTREEVMRWLLKSLPFRDIADFRSRLDDCDFKGVNQRCKNAMVESLSLRLGRRPFAAALGLSSLAALGLGIRTVDAGDFDTTSVPGSIRPLVRAFQQQRNTIGQAFEAMAQQDASWSSEKQAQDAMWRQFMHALDMSNWIEAASFLQETPFRDRVVAAAANSPTSPLIASLCVLQSAWAHLVSIQAEWEDEYFVAYAFGKMPALARASSTGPENLSDGARSAGIAEAIHRLAPMFHALEILNQRFQRSARTRTRAPVRFTQGHNFSYAHIGADLQDRNRFPLDRRTVLVNWDAHADLSDPFENPRMPQANSIDALRNAQRYPEHVVVAGSMSIAGWILPLIYRGLLDSNDQPAEIVWVAPRESLLTSKNYMEPYGRYSIVVGDWKLPSSMAEIASVSTSAVGDWNHPGSIEIRRFSKQPTLTSVTSQNVLSSQRQCIAHIVDPDEPDALAHLIGDANIALSVDADFAGTRAPGLRTRKKFLPHFPLDADGKGQARHERLMQRLEDFYERFAPQVKTVSIANSPNFTVGEATRKPVAKVLRIVADESSLDQPGWVAGELDRVAPQPKASGVEPVPALLSAGGIVGLTGMATLLSGDWLRLKGVRAALTSEYSGAASDGN